MHAAMHLRKWGIQYRTYMNLGWASPTSAVQKIDSAMRLQKRQMGSSYPVHIM